MVHRSLFSDPSTASTQSMLELSEATLVGVENPELAKVVASVLGARRGRMGFMDFTARMDARITNLGDLLHQPCSVASEEKSSYILAQNKELTFQVRIASERIAWP